MLKLIRRFFGWWYVATMSVSFTIFKKAKLVGKDDYGNKYYEDKKTHPTAGRKRRFVIYRGLAEPSLISAKWHGWLHYTFQDLPDDDDISPTYQRDHFPNMTGTPLAYYPHGSLNKREKLSEEKNYQAWNPNKNYAKK